MRRLANIALFVVITLLVSCGESGVVRHTEPLYTPRYAKGFSIERDVESGAKLLCVKNPWQGAEEVLLYTEIDTMAPAKRIIAMSSSHAAMLDAVGCANRIVGLSGCRFIYNPALGKAIEEGQIGEVGYDNNFDFEKICALSPDMVLLYGVAGEAKGITGKLDELRIPYLYIGDYLEADPLGKAEWVVAIAALCGEQKRGEALFNDIEERYIGIKTSVAKSDSHPRVMLNLPYRDTWFMPSKGSYMVRLIEDAGGSYILTENGKRKTENCLDERRDERQDERREANISQPISLEEALELAMRCDVWLNLGQIASLAELCATAPRFADVEAVRSGRIYNNTKRTNPSRGSDFWESGAVRPDIILEDLVKILHHKAPTDSLYYYKKLE